MAKVPINSCLLLSRRAYKVAAANVRGQAVMKKVVPETNFPGNRVPSVGKDTFWMKDPKTGDWVPETHLDNQADAAELRDNFLPH